MKPGRENFINHQMLNEAMSEMAVRFGQCFGVFIGNRCDFVSPNREDAERRARGTKSVYGDCVKLRCRNSTHIGKVKP